MKSDAERDRLLAHYYDLEYSNFALDIDFYVELAGALDPKRKLPVLELGCGTGRISVALAEHGSKVVCADISEGMLDVCSAKAREHGVQKKVKPIHSDMRNLTGVPAGPYNLAFCALNTFAYLLTGEDQLAMLAAVRSRLVSHGILVLDLTPPLPHLAPPSDGELVHQGTFRAGDGSQVHKFITGRADAANQFHNITLLYDQEAVDGTLTRTSQALTLRWTGRYEMELLLKTAGYRIENLYGSYDLDDFDSDSERMIFVART